MSRRSQAYQQMVLSVDSKLDSLGRFANSAVVTDRSKSSGCNL